MKRTKYIFFPFVALTLCAAAQERQSVPSALIKRIIHFSFSDNRDSLVLDVLHFLNSPAQLDESSDPVFTPIIANLDEDTNPEILFLVGLQEYNTRLVLLKELGGQWYLLFHTDVNVWYSPPELLVANNASVNKLFYTRQLYERGSGVFREGYEFYKLINGKVYKCLELLNETRVNGWALLLNQDVRSKFTIPSSNSDVVLVKFYYTFFPGPIYDSDPDFIGHADTPILRDDDSMEFMWDSLSSSYKPHFYASPGSLTKEKLQCFAEFGNDSLFLNAFKSDIEVALKEGTAEQKNTIRDYLKAVEARGYHSHISTDLEEKATQGGIKLYGPKKPKKK